MFQWRVLVLWIGVYVVLHGVITLASFQSTPAFALDPPDDLRPGRPVPTWSHCAWSGPGARVKAPDQVWMCGEGPYHLYILDGSIASVALSPPDVRLGDLIVAWGTPTGYKHANALQNIYWPGRFVYVADAPLSPQSPVRLVVWTDTVPIGPWRGFSSLASYQK